MTGQGIARQASALFWTCALRSGLEGTDFSRWSFCTPLQLSLVSTPRETQSQRSIGPSGLGACPKDIKGLGVFPSDGSLPMGKQPYVRMNEHLDSDEELVPSFNDSDSPDLEDDVNDFLPDFEFDTTESYIKFYDVRFESLLYLFRHLSPSPSPQT